MFTSPCDVPHPLPKWGSSCPQILLTLGTPIPGFLFQSLKTSTPQNQAAAVFFSQTAQGTPPTPPLFLPALSLYLFIFDLMALWSWRGALQISNYPLNCWTWSACDISPWQNPFQGVCKWTLVSLLKAMMSMDVPSQGMSLLPTMITWVRFIHESSSFHP